MIDLKQNTLLREIPNNLLVDKKVIHLANSLQNSLDKMLDWAEKINFEMNLDKLDDALLDHLLWEKHITWSEGLGLADTREKKIKLIQDAIELHRIKGTPAAIELVFSILDIDSKLTEWFQYGGDPYHFKVQINIHDKGLNEATYNMLTALIYEYKNVRSYLEAIEIYFVSKSQSYVGACSIFGEEISVYPWQITNIDAKGAYRIGSGQQLLDTTTIYPKGGN